MYCYKYLLKINVFIVLVDYQTESKIVQDLLRHHFTNCFNCRSKTWPWRTPVGTIARWTRVRRSATKVICKSPSSIPSQSKSRRRRTSRSSTTHLRSTVKSFRKFKNFFSEEVRWFSNLLLYYTFYTWSAS